jgi:prolyl-tRNA synthetase
MRHSCYATPVGIKQPTASHVPFSHHRLQQQRLQPIARLPHRIARQLPIWRHFSTSPKAPPQRQCSSTPPERGLIFVVIRGDREVHAGKLRRAIGVSELRPAETSRIRAVGAVPGYASPVGLNGVFVVADQSVVQSGPLVAGANHAGYHLQDVVYGRDWHADCVADINTVGPGDHCPQCAAPLVLEQGVEIGRVEHYDAQFSRERGATYLNEQGQSRPLQITYAGIALERLLQISVEHNCDERGIIWPIATAPADIQLVALGKGVDVRSAAEQVAAELREAGFRVLYDDRDESAGVKFTTPT